MTLIVYDNTGNIFYKVTGSYEVPQGGIQFLEVEVSKGKQVTGVNVTVTPHQAILEDIPPTEVDILKRQISDLEDALVEIADLVAMGGSI